MSNLREAAFAAYIASVHADNGYPSDGRLDRQFDVAPPIATAIEQAITESPLTRAFLSQITTLGVRERTEKIIPVGLNATLASRSPNRAGRNLLNASERKYVLHQVNYDSVTPYELMDQWAATPDFISRYRQALIDQMAIDRLMIGWNGTTAASTTNSTANPLGQDVNVGWLQKCREENPSRVMTAVGSSDSIKLGVDGDMKNLDQLVLFLKTTMIHETFQQSPGLVAIVGSDLIDNKLFDVVGESGNKATEINASSKVLNSVEAGGLKVVRAPHFPARGVVVTELKNLGFYYQTSGRRRTIKDMPEHNGVSDFNSSVEGYVIQSLERMAMAEPTKIKLKNAAGVWE